jgi:hypothetical protein
MVTVITKTIKPSGGDYATPQLAEADVATIAGGTDLVALDVAIVFEIDTGKYDGYWQIRTSGINADETRNVTYRAAEGVRRGHIDSGALITRDAGSLVCTINDKYTRVQGLSFTATTSNCVNVNDVTAVGVVVDGCAMRAIIGNCIVLDQGGSAAAPVFVQNNLCVTESSRGVDVRGTRAEAHYKIINNTFDTESHAIIVGSSSSTDIVLELTNNLVFSLRSYFYNSSAHSGTLTQTGTNNVGGATNPFATDELAGGQTWDVGVDPTVASDGNNVIYSTQTYKLVTADGNDARLVGVGPDVNSNVPREDITGQTRTGNIVNPGAFQSLTHTWTVMAYSHSPLVNVDGVITVDTDNINVYHDTLTVTTASGTDNTPALPVGTKGLWVSVKEMGGTGALMTVELELNASDSVTLCHLGVVITAASAALLYKCPLEVQANDGTYPRIKLDVSGASGSANTSLEVLAIGAQNSDGSWS